MSTNPAELIWFEKHRPRTLDEMALDAEHRRQLTHYIEKGEIPHLLFVGPAGCGKTTVSKMLIRAVDCDVMSMNASKERGIDVIRDKIIAFAKSLGFRKWKTVFLDEADGLTPDAQNSLRNAMEDYHEQTRFILTGNYRHRIIDALQSRCTTFEFGETPVQERYAILAGILQKESVPIDPTVVLGYAEKFRDLRKMINAAQQSVQAHGGQLGPASTVAFLGSDLLKLVANKDWNKLLAAASSASFDHREALRNMFWAVTDTDMLIKQPIKFRAVLSKAFQDCRGSDDPVVFFLGTMSELIDLQS